LFHLNWPRLNVRAETVEAGDDRAGDEARLVRIKRHKFVLTLDLRRFTKMGGENLADWSPTRDPKKNAEIEAQLRVEKRVDAGIAEIHRRRMEKLPHAAEYVGILIKQYLDEWALWVNTAIGDVSIPADKDGKIWWWVALAGNLIWAATILHQSGCGRRNALDQNHVRVLEASGGVAWVGYYIAVAGVISFLAVMSMRETRQTVEKVK
jgi:hypothetical protein